MNLYYKQRAQREFHFLDGVISLNPILLTGRGSCAKVGDVLFYGHDRPFLERAMAHVYTEGNSPMLGPSKVI